MALNGLFCADVPLKNSRPPISHHSVCSVTKDQSLLASHHSQLLCHVS